MNLKGVILGVVVVVSGYGAAYLLLYGQASDMADIRSWSVVDESLSYINENYNWNLYVDMINSTPMVFEISAKLDVFSLIHYSQKVVNREPLEYEVIVEEMNYFGLFEVDKQNIAPGGSVIKSVVVLTERTSSGVSEDAMKAVFQNPILRGKNISEFKPYWVRGNIEIHTSLWFIPFNYSFSIDEKFVF